MLSSQLAILVDGRAGTSLPVGQLPRGFLLDQMLDQWLHGRKSRERFLCPFHSAFKAASHLQDDASVFGLVYSGCPGSCLMAPSDRGHPSVRSPGHVVLVCHKAKVGGVSPPRVPRGTPSLNTDEKKEVMPLSGLPILVPRTAGSARLLSTTGSCERRCPGSNFSSRDFVCRTECHSTSKRGSRGEDETAVPCSTDPWSQPPNRTSLSTSYKIHSGVYRIYHKSAQRA